MFIDLNQRFPDRTAIWSQLHDLQQKKLWYQFTVLLNEVLSQSFLSEFDAAILVYNTFIKPNEAHLSPHSVANMLVSISRRASEPTESFNFLIPYVHILRPHPVPYCVILLHLAHLQLLRSVQPSPMESSESPQDEISTKNTEDLIAMATEVIDKEGLATLPENNHVMAKLYQVKAEMNRNKDYSGFVTNMFEYLAYVDDPSRDYPAISDLALDIVVSGLCSPDVYNISDIVGNPIVEHLESGEVKRLLDVFNGGDVKGFQTLCDEKVLSVDVRLGNSSKVLEEKIKILGIMEVAFSKPINDRQLKFSEICTRCSIPENDAEYLLIRVMSLGLIRGKINSVNKEVGIEFVQPRALGPSQVETLATHLRKWLTTVENAHQLAQSRGQLPEEMVGEV
ncbi:hypothetical protein P9112_003096 [Eukaryota sp. TZLM1-RC]